MANPEIYYKVRLQKPGSPDRMEFITENEVRTRGLLAQLLGGTAAQYVKIGPANFQLLDNWKREQRAKRGKK